MLDEDWVLVRTKLAESSVRSYLVVTVLEWEKYRESFPNSEWEELTRGTEAEMRRMHKLAQGD